GNVKETNDFERFLATTYVAGFGHPNRLGPNSLDKMRLKNYLQLHNEEHVLVTRLKNVVSYLTLSWTICM
ncbi:hypothetical protein MNBD_PLANCTO02-556, partial [hydrothermal vent metagenome]